MKKVLRAFLWFVIAGIITIFLLFFYNTKIVESREPISTAPATTKFIDVGGEKIAYTETDNHASTTAVFVGGLSAWGGTWERVVSEINSKRNDINYLVIDLPPFGYSIPSSDKNYFRDTQAERIAGVVENKKINHIILVAHSYGAGPSVEYAMRHEDKVEKLIIIDGVLNINEPKVVNKQSPVQIDFLRNFLLGVLVHNDSFAISRLKTFVNIRDHVDQKLLDVYTRYFDTKNTTMRLSQWFRDYVNDPLNYQSNLSSSYEKILMPVRLIWGDKDTITPIEGTKVLLDTVPNIKLIALSGVGHIPMIEDYERFDAALFDALKK
ncbi:MAG: alpha/beta hydrolase [bacterium]|nr:alpha/beta hydrolase [bacterium]